MDFFMTPEVCCWTISITSIKYQSSYFELTYSHGGAAVEGDPGQQPQPYITPTQPLIWSFYFSLQKPHLYVTYRRRRSGQTVLKVPPRSCCSVMDPFII